MRNIVKKYIATLFEASDNMTYEGVDYFRHRLLVCLLLCLSVFGTIAYVPSVYYAYLHRFHSVILLDTLAIGGIFFLLSRKQMGFMPRALGTLSIF